jgi:hypothetical protein
MMKSFLKISALSLVTLCTHGHAACTGSTNQPAQYFSISFDEERSDVPKEQAQRFSAWASEMLAKHPLQQWLSISGDAMPNESEPEALARRRAIETAKLALDKGLSNAPIEIKTEVGSKGNPSSYGPEGRSAFIQLSVGCPDDCCEK